MLTIFFRFNSQLSEQSIVKHILYKCDIIFLFDSFIQITTLSGTPSKTRSPSVVTVSTKPFKLIYRKFLQSKNNFPIETTLLILKLDKSTEVNDKHPKNIKEIFVNCEVSKLDKFKDFNDVQLSNILFIIST